MGTVVYVGGSSIRGLGPVDFEKMGIKVDEDLEFIANVPTEVSDDVEEALLNHPLVASEFIGVDDKPHRILSDLEKAEAFTEINQAAAENGEPLIGEVPDDAPNDDGDEADDTAKPAKRKTRASS